MTKGAKSWTGRLITYRMPDNRQAVIDVDGYHAAAWPCSGC